jgi:enamine deaminase RidA (YjgF/YER057c/UK114 family)
MAVHSGAGFTGGKWIWAPAFYLFDESRSMTRKLISSGSPFETQVGYSRAVVQGDWCFVAGTTGPDPVTKTFPDTVAEQAQNALAIVTAALAEGGFALDDVVRATYYITDAAYWDQIGPVLGAAFGTIRPAATCIVCGLVRPEMKFEVEVTALKRS